MSTNHTSRNKQRIHNPDCLQEPHKILFEKSEELERLDWGSDWESREKTPESNVWLAKAAPLFKKAAAMGTGEKTHHKENWPPESTIETIYRNFEKCEGPSMTERLAQNLYPGIEAMLPWRAIFKKSPAITILHADLRARARRSELRIWLGCSHVGDRWRARHLIQIPVDNYVEERKHGSPLSKLIAKTNAAWEIFTQKDSCGYYIHQPPANKRDLWEANKPHTAGDPSASLK